MAQQKKHHHETSLRSRVLHLRSKWRVFFAVLLTSDLLFILQILHAIYIYPATMSGSTSVAFVALYGWYIILLLAIIHIAAVAVYLMMRRPQDYRLVISTIVAIVSLFLLYQFDLVGVVKGISEKMTIPNESTISKKTALRLLQECRINDLVITQMYGAKVTFSTQEPDWPRVKTVYLEEEDIAEFRDAVKAKGSECGEEIEVFNDGTVGSAL